jgi:hypothetical protein
MRLSAMFSGRMRVDGDERMRSSNIEAIHTRHSGIPRTPRPRGSRRHVTILLTFLLAVPWHPHYV